MNNECTDHDDHDEYKLLSFRKLVNRLNMETVDGDDVGYTINENFINIYFENNGIVFYSDDDSTLRMPHVLINSKSVERREMSIGTVKFVLVFAKTVSLVREIAENELIIGRDKRIKYRIGDISTISMLKK